jgi:alanyl-tRNA synthetase
MKFEEIRESFLDFFKKKGHVVVPSSSLIPDDPSVLLTTAGMQQFKRYFTGELDAVKNLGAANAVSVQKCFRTSDIDEVGDVSHLTFFEMLGNFSFGGYFKREAIRWAYEYATEILGISPERISVAVFSGDKNVPYDEESYRIWHKEIGLPAGKIRKRGRSDNFWGPTGDEGPCGPTTEIYVDGLEIWNLVFNEYYCAQRGLHGQNADIADKSRRRGQDSPGSQLKSAESVLIKLETPGVDTGMGFERLTAVLQGVEDIFQTDIFQPLISGINDAAPHLKDREVRILADHLRACAFLIADGVRPSNKEAGYVLRRILRRILVYQILYDIHADLMPTGVQIVKEKFQKFYPEIADRRILEVMESERDKFQKALAAGLKELQKFKTIAAPDAFYLYETFGLPFEVIKELAAEAAKNLQKSDFEAEFKKHQQISRSGAEKKFGGHGLILNTGELKAGSEEELQKVIRLHTATHLLQAALRRVLGTEVRQTGSDITAERARFDFVFPRKLTPEEIKSVEDLINDIIQKDLPVGFIEMSKTEAEKTGALYFFKEKYPERVKVYYVGHSLEDAFSKEFCGGPHVDHTLTIGKFKIIKEEAVGSGARRIRGIVL